MMKISRDIVRFFENQDYVIVSTITSSGATHNSCKGIIDINSDGRIYLLDLYHGNTYINLKNNPHISIAAVDGHQFKGYSLSGKARIAKFKEFEPHLIEAWEKRITSRITQRILKNITGEKGHPRHPEAFFPDPKYMIVMRVGKVVDLTPHHLK